MIRDFSILKIDGVEVMFDGFSIIACLLIVLFAAQFGLPFYFRGFSEIMYWWISIMSMCCVLILIVIQQIIRIICAFILNCPVRKVTVFLMGCLEEVSGDLEKRNTVENVSALIAILYSVSVSFIFHAFLVTGKNDHWPLELRACITIIYLTIVIITLSSFFPAYPLDGGKLFKNFLYLISRNISFSCKFTKGLGTVSSLLIVSTALLMAVNGMIIGCVCLFIIGLLIHRASDRSNQMQVLRDEMGGENVGQVMQCIYAVSNCVCLNTVLQEYHLKTEREYFAILDQKQKFINVLSAQQLKNISIEKRDVLVAGDLVCGLAELPKMERNTEIISALSLMIENDYSIAVVVESGPIDRVVGVVTLHKLILFIVNRLILS